MLSALSGLLGQGSSSPIQGLYLASIPARYAIYPLSYLLRFAMAGLGGRGAAAGVAGNEALLGTINQLVNATLAPLGNLVHSQLASAARSVSAHMGLGHSVGLLSVPQTWAATSPAMTRVAPVLPETSVSSPTVSASMPPGNPFTQAMLGTLSGRGISSLAARVAPKVVPRLPSGG